MVQIPRFTFLSHSHRFVVLLLWAKFTEDEAITMAICSLSPIHILQRTDGIVGISP